MGFSKSTRLLIMLLYFYSAIIVASQQTGKVSSLIVRANDGLTYFTLDSSTPNGKPACATISYWMIKDENSEAGKKQYTMVLAAQTSGKKISVIGGNTCTRWSDGEDVNSITLTNN